MPTATPMPKELLLRLYVAGNAPNSVQAVENLEAICAEHFPSHEIEIVDLLKAPLRALQDDIIVTPTLLRLRPLPVVRVIGSLTDRRQVLLVLSPR